MSKLTIIQLLNKIANGEEVPKKIKYDGIEYEEEPCYMLYEVTGDCSESQLKNLLNDEVEIIEEDNKDKKINRLEILDWEAFKIMTVGDKYELYKNIITIMNVFIDCINNSYEDNDLIDKLNSMENKQ